MTNKEVEGFKDTFISNFYPCSNYSKCTNLLVSKGVRYNNCLEYVITLLRFETTILGECSKIIKAELNLYVEGICSCEEEITIIVSKILAPYNDQTVCWNSGVRFSNCGYKKTISSKTRCEFIKIDVTDIVRSWRKKESPNYGIAIVAESDIEQLWLGSSKGKHKNYISVECEDNTCCPCIKEYLNAKSKEIYKLNPFEAIEFIYKKEDKCEVESEIVLEKEKTYLIQYSIRGESLENILRFALEIKKEGKKAFKIISVEESKNKCEYGYGSMWGTVNIEVKETSKIRIVNISKNESKNVFANINILEIG